MSVGVLVRVNHELDAAFNTMLLLAFTNLVENSVDYFINPVFTDVNNGINKAMLHVLIIRINLCSCCYLCCITLYYNCIDYLLDETHVRVHFGYSGNLLIDFCKESKLFSGLRKHLLMFSSNSLLLFFFLSSDACLFLRDLIAAALAAPLLALSRSEVICPFMALLAVNLDDSLFIADIDSEVATVTLSLHADCIDNLHAVVAQLMNFICELPECNMAAKANIFAVSDASSPSRFLLSDDLLLATLFNCVSLSDFFFCIDLVCTNKATTALAASCLSIVIISVVRGDSRGDGGFWSRDCHGYCDGDISMAALGSLSGNMCEIRSIGCSSCCHSVLYRVFNIHIYADLGEEVVNFLAADLLLLRPLPTMLMMMRMLMWIIGSILVIIIGSDVSSRTIPGSVIDYASSNASVGSSTCSLLLSLEALLVMLLRSSRDSLLRGLGLVTTVAVVAVASLLGCEMGLMLLGLPGTNGDVLLLSLLLHFSCSCFWGCSVCV